MSNKPTPSAFELVGMGVTTALCIAAGLGGGYWLDGRFHTGPALTFAGLVIGVLAAVAATYLQIKKYL